MAITKYKENGKTLFKVDIRIGDKRPRRGGFTSKEDAERYIDGIKKAVGGSSNRFTTAELDDVVIKYLAIVSVKKSKTLQTLEERWFKKLSLYLKKVCKKKYLYEIDLLDLESYQTALNKHVSAGTVNRRFDSFKSLFNKCVDWGLLADSPAERLKKLPHQNRRRKTWRKNEILEVYKALPERYSRLFYFIALTGCRPGEARLLTWTDVDLKNDLVILRSIKGNQGERVREFPLTGSFKAFMKNHHEKQKRAMLSRPSDIVFPSKDGRHFDPTSLQKRVKKVVNHLGLSEDLCVYGLRHTFTTSLIEQDINLEKVRLLVGHEKITTTQNYAHVDKKSLRDAAQRYKLKEGAG